MIVVDIYEPKQLKRVADEVKSIGVDAMILAKKGGIVVERKTWDDLYSSIFEGRLANQVRRLKIIAEEKGYMPMLVLEGNFYATWKRRKIRISSWIAGKYSGVLHKGVMIYPSMGTWETAELYKFLDRKMGKEKVSLRGIEIDKKGRTIEEEAEDVLCSFTGVGRKKARILLEKYGSLRNVFAKDGFRELGKKTYEHIKEVLDYEFKSSRSLLDDTR